RDYAQTFAANAELEPEGEDRLRDTDERVFERLADLLDEFIANLFSERFGFLPEDGDGTLLGELASDGYRNVDFKSLAQAIFYGVDPDARPREIKRREAE